MPPNAIARFMVMQILEFCEKGATQSSTRGVVGATL